MIKKTNEGYLAIAPSGTRKTWKSLIAAQNWLRFRTSNQ